MQDLQLALSPGRVEQRNFGLWLNSWQVGKVLQALVVDQAPSGQLLLRIGAHKVSATTDLPVQKGATLKLEVSALSPTPTLKILSTNGQTPATGSTTQLLPKTPMEQQLPALMARQGNVSNALAALSNRSSNANLLALLGANNNGSSVQAVLKHLYQPSDLNSATKLRQAVERSGLFFEAKGQQATNTAQPNAPRTTANPVQTPAQGSNTTSTQHPTNGGTTANSSSQATSNASSSNTNALLAATAKQANAIAPAARASVHIAPTSLSTPTSTAAVTVQGELPQPLAVPGSGDFKGDIQRLLKHVQQLLLSPQKHTAITPGARESLTVLRDQLDGALSHITLQQVTCQASDAKGQTCFLVDIPITVGNQTDELHLTIERDGKQDDNSTSEEDNWRITLRLNPPNLGPVAAKLNLKAQYLSVSLLCEQATTHAIMSAQLLPLQSRLEQLGFDVTRLNAAQDTSSETMPEKLAQHFNITVSERV